MLKKGNLDIDSEPRVGKVTINRKIAISKMSGRSGKTVIQSRHSDLDIQHCNYRYASHSLLMGL